MIMKKSEAPDQNHDLDIYFKEMADWKALQSQHVYGLLNERKSGSLCF